jgi:tetrahydromethanopterin S-methyltransferase subunit E
MKNQSIILLCLGLFWSAAVSIVLHYHPFPDGLMGILYGIGIGLLVMALIKKPRRSST